MIHPVIIEPHSQRDSVRALVQYIKELDGTEVRVIPLTLEDDARFVPEYPECEKASRASFSLHLAALAMKGKPFIWLEHDSLPLKKGWAQTLSDEYARLKKPFMLSSDSHPPYDLVGGIGVYSGDTSWMIPQHFRSDPDRHVGWDLWMVRNLGPLISRTPLVQHSYGVYKDGHAQQHEFPRDNHILRRDAVIFHRDARHDLLEQPQPESVPTFYHSGDLGDIIYHLETIRRMGGGCLVLGSDLGLGPNLPSRCREPMTPSRVENLKPLLITQDYIQTVEHWTGKPNPTWLNLNLFRETFRPSKGSTCENLQRASLRRFGMPVQDETQPWLATEKFCGPLSVVMARSERYHDDTFPWKEIVERYHKSAVFVGSRTEYEKFKEQFGMIGYEDCKDLAYLAKIINSASVFIGNQSCPYAIAEGLKKPCVQETWQTEPNCLFQRPHLLNMTTDFKRISEFIDAHL